MPRSINLDQAANFAAQFVLNVDPDDIVEGLLGRGETELDRRLDVEIARPAVNDPMMNGSAHA